MHVARPDRVAVAALTVVALFAPVRADAQAQKKLAVLQFGVSKLTNEDRKLLGDRLYFSERVRSLVLESRPPVALITQDEMGQIMAANAEAAANCEEGQCVRQGELLGADLLIAGEFTRVGRSLILVMKLISLELTADRKRIERQLASSQARGKEPDELIDALTPTMQKLLAPLHASPKGARGASGGPAAVETGRVGGVSRDFEVGSEDTVIVSFETTPMGGFVVLDGEPLCQTPCSKEVAPGRHQVKLGKDGYETATRELEAKRGAKVSVKLLRSVALIAVETTPSGLAVSIDGKPAGKSPVAARELAPGAHEVVVEDPCWVREGEKLAVQKGEEKTVRISPKPRMAGIKLKAEDNQGNALEGTAIVDSKAVGVVPGSHKVALCSRKLEVRTSVGSWSQDLKLSEGELATFSALVRTAHSPEAPAAHERASKTGRFIVQLGASPDEKVARKMELKARDAGFDVYVLAVDLGSKGTWYRVRVVGSFGSEDEAAIVQKQAERSLRVPAMVMPAQ